MFHHLTNECANLLIGTSKALRSDEAWHQVYRARDHTYTRGQCKNKSVLAKFPKGIEDFANLFVNMQTKRHKADYDPTVSFSKSGVINDLGLVEQAIEDFSAEPVADRRAFCAFILFKERKN